MMLKYYFNSSLTLFFLFFHRAHGNESLIAVDKAQGAKNKNTADSTKRTAKCFLYFATPRFATAINESLTISKDHTHASNAQYCSKSRARSGPYH